MVNILGNHQITFNGRCSSSREITEKSQATLGISRNIDHEIPAERKSDGKWLAGLLANWKIDTIEP